MFCFNRQLVFISPTLCLVGAEARLIWHCLVSAVVYYVMERFCISGIVLIRNLDSICFHRKCHFFFLLTNNLKDFCALCFVTFFTEYIMNWQLNFIRVIWWELFFNGDRVTYALFKYAIFMKLMFLWNFWRWYSCSI